MIVNIYLLGIVATVVATLVGKYIWSRWLSKSSRITEQKCKDNQALCFLKVVARIDKLTDELSCGDANFELIKISQDKTTHTLKLILMTLSELCVIGEGCEESTKERIRVEMLS